MTVMNFIYFSVEFPFSKSFSKYICKSIDVVLQYSLLFIICIVLLFRNLSI